MNERQHYMKTLSEILEKLRIQRHDNEFKIDKNCFLAANGNRYSPQDLTIIKVYRFEGESDPSDSSILYIIEAKDGLIGYSLDAYGVYSNHNDEDCYDEFVRKIPVKDRDEQLIFSLEKDDPRASVL